MSGDTVSVVIPSYNYAGYLRQAVGSVAAQTYKNLELVIVDDASSDGSLSVISDIKNKYLDRFRNIEIIVHEKNMGAHAAINRGVRESSGKYITILNADDMYEPCRIEILSDRIGDGGIAFSAVKCINKDGEILNSPQAKRFESAQSRLAGAEFCALAALAENPAVSTGNMLFKKELYEKLGGFKNYKYVHDYDFFLRAALIAEPVYTQETAYLYRLHGDNTFTKIHKTGVLENRLLWLDAYYNIKKGNIGNAAILSHGDYMRLFEAQIAKEGRKKQFLWERCGNPFARLALKIVKGARKIK